jgi:alkanesulfonate monooxygenase SsuD/methylene tetrahydromethanopterin reductase-like flavin-dependent oxidoreductase (luciferase family)
VAVGVVILPDLRWREALPRWREAQDRGFTTAWTYDHLSWRSLRDATWLGCIPLLAAVAASTTELRVGTLVTSPNFRHPAPLAKDAMTLDEISGGRFDLGIGAGGTGYDAHVLGAPAPTPAERTARFVEFVDALDLLLREPAATFEGRWFTAIESRTFPGCTQRPRVPFTVAAAGPRGLRVAATHGQTWVTYGPLQSSPDRDEWLAGVTAQSRQLDVACEEIGRDPSTIRRMALLGLEVSWAQASVGAWQEISGALEERGFSDVVVHWPRPHDPDLPGPSPAAFDAMSPG